MKKFILKTVSVLLTIMLMISIIPVDCIKNGATAILDFSVKTKAADANDFSATFTNGLKYMDGNTANSFIGFIYNVRTDRVSDDMRSMGDIYRYLTGGFTKGTDEYEYAQFCFLITSEYFINKQISTQSSYASQATNNLITFLQKKVGSDESGAQQLVNSELGKVKGYIKKVLYYAFDMENDEIIQNIDMVLSSYNNVTSLVDKVKKLIESVYVTINTYYLITATNTLKAYNYYTAYLNNRDIGTEQGLLELIMNANNIGSVSAIDSIPIFLEKLGFGNSWTSEDVQRVLRVFAEFTYHSRKEFSQLSDGNNLQDIHKHSTAFYEETDDDVIFACSSCGEKFPYEKCKYEVVDGEIDVLYGYSVLQYCRYIKLDSSEHFPYRAVTEGAFSNSEYLKGIEKIIIPEGYTTLGKNSFSGCVNVKDVYLPSSIKEIGYQAFPHEAKVNIYYAGTIDQWQSLNIGGHITSEYNLYINNSLVETININSNVKSYAFAGCQSIKYINIEANVSSFDDLAFNNCINLKKINYKGTFEEWFKISFGFFDANPNIYAQNLYINGKLLSGTVRIPKNTDSIPRAIFAGCKDITAIDWGNNIKEIRPYAFYKCSGLKEVSIPDTVTYIGAYSFYGCTDITAIDLGNNIKEIGSYAFYKCSGLKEVSIPDTVTYIGTYSFYGCTGMNKLYIGESVKDLGSCPFKGCSSLREVLYNAKSSEITRSTTSTFGGLSTVFPFCPIYKIEFGNSVECIPMQLCSKITSLSEVVISENVKTIRTRAFYGCKNLKVVNYKGNPEQWSQISFGTGTANPVYYSENLWINGKLLTDLTLSDDISGISHYSFARCKDLVNVTLKDGITSIEANAFKGSGIKRILLPDSINNIGDGAIPNETTIYCYSGSYSHTYAANNNYRYFLIDKLVSVSEKDIIINDKTNMIYGINGNQNYLKSKLNLEQGFSIDFGIPDGKIKTGDILSIKDTDGFVLKTYQTVLFGDVNGDGWYDGTDAITVSMIANGMLSREQVGEAVWMAADCNHDGVINQADVDLLNQAGVLLANVDQTKSPEELLETSAEYNEYLNLIDQSVAVEEKKQETEMPDSSPSNSGLNEKILMFAEYFINLILELFSKIF